MAPTNPFAESTVYDVLATIASRHPARESIVFGDERISFAALLTRVDALAAGLSALGLGKGDTLAIWLPNRPVWYVAQYAAAKLGIVVVALNPRYRAHELAYILGQSDTKALLLTDHLGAIDYFETLHDVVPELPAAAPGELASATLPALRWIIVDAEDPYPGCVRVQDVVDAGADSGPGTRARLGNPRVDPARRPDGSRVASEPVG
ncbi:MAG: AMP-binding protein, partial [Candidatus Rokuibacteriota bacterium]